MSDKSGREVLLAAISEKEWRRVPSEIARKLETYIGGKFDELITSKALQETKSYAAVHNLSELQGSHETLTQEHQKIGKKLDHANSAITELENQLTNSVADVGKLQTNCNKLENDLSELKNQRNALAAEKEELSRMVERRASELERMQCDLTVLTKQLEESVSAKCEALSKINEVQSMKLAMEYKEKHMEQEKSLLKNQIASLTKDLETRTDELLHMRRDNSSRCVQLDIKLTERIQELANANDTIKHLTEKNTNYLAKTEELINKLAQEKDNYFKAMEAYQHEVDAQAKIAELYQNVSEQQTKHAEELGTAVQELKEKLDDALEKYGDLETKFKENELAHEEIVAKKTEYISMLKKELETANDLISNRPDVSAEDEDAMPKMKTGLSFTEIYSRYVQVTESMAHEKAENKRLQSYIQSIIQELEDKGPLIAKQREHYEKALDSIDDMTRQLEAISSENQQLRDINTDLKRSELSVARENGRLKKEVSDLSRQVCHLLREVEVSRTGSSITSMDHDLSDSTCSADIITKRLVTFSDINELQSTNSRLLALVRELSTKQEEAESMDPDMIMAMKQKLDQMRDQHAALLEEQEKQHSMMKMLIEQRDTYKGLYHQFLKGSADALDGDKTTSTPNKNGESDAPITSEKYQELEQTLEKKSKELTLMKEELDTYKLEKTGNEKMILEEKEKMRTELQEMMRQNFKLSSKCETSDEMIKVSKSNADVYKGQIERLEDRIKIYSETIVKHESSQQYLKEQLMQTQTKLAKTESQLNSLEKTTMLLRDSEARIKFERDHLLREQQSQSTMSANIELIKATLERNDAESKMRLEDILKEAHRECAALRRRLQEEQDSFRLLVDSLKQQTASAQKQMEEERAIADSLRANLNHARDDVLTKSQQIEELSKKLKNPILDELEVSVERRKIRELEQNLFDTQATIESLTQKLRISKEAVEQHMNVAQAAEIQLKDINQQFVLDKAEFEKQITTLQKKIEELEEQNAELQGELSLQSDGQVSATSTLHSKLGKLEIQHKVVNDDLLTTKNLLEEAKDNIRQLQENINVAENKYIEEMRQRSEELQILRAIKEERVKLVDELNDMKSQRDRLQDSLDLSKSSWANQEEMYIKTKNEVETRSDELNKQNTLLLNQLEALNEQMALLHNKISDPNRSYGDTSLNKSLIEDENKSSDQLVKVIKFLRREKDLAINKCEILEAEHNRIQAEQEVLKRQYEEAKSALDSERQNTEVSIATASRHAEVLRKVETLNALTDSNRSLRFERDSLMNELEELKKRTTSLEEQMAPLQEKNHELQKKAEAMQTENINLRGDVTRWRQRANILIEKSNRTSPEDWKKLQQERETLAKQLTIERGTTAKLTEENNNINGENHKLEEQLRNLSSQLDANRNETSRLNEELGTLRQQVTTLNGELDQVRVQIINVNEDNRRLNENMAGKDIAINDAKNNLSQIRKIAKKYKIQAEELQKEMEGLKQQIQKTAEGGEIVSPEKRDEILQEGRIQLEERINQLEQTHNERIIELNQQVSVSQEESEKSRKDIETLNEKLSSSLEKEERFKVLFKNAKDRIVSLTSQNNSLRSQIESRDGNSADGNNGGSAGDNPDLQRCLKEKEEIMSENQVEKDRLLRDIESLNQRVSQLQRQLGQQGSKPSTSSEKEKSTTEPPTANIKPMAGHSTNTQQQSVPIQPWRSGGEPPLASIRPMSQQRTAAVLPTSQSPSTVMVPPQQQVHTTANSGIEAMSSSPTSSHTDYIPATSSASMLGPRQVAVPPTQSNQDNEDDDSNQVQQVQQQQGVAIVMPRVEPPSPSPAQEQGTSSSSNTVTTTQAGHKRPRETTSDGGEDSKTSQQPKRTRIVQGTSSSGAEGSVSESGLDVEYQVPTSSQRDHEEDAVIVVESDEEGPDEGDGDDYTMPYEDADQDDEAYNEVEVIEDSSEVPNQSERGENDMQPDADADEDEEDCEAGEERDETMQPEATSSGTNISTSVAVTLPSFSRSRVAPLSRNQQGNLVVMQAMDEAGEEEEKAMQPEATSSGTNVSTSVAVTMPSFSRTRVAPLTRNQQGNLVVHPGLGDEGGDDGIVPSTPTLATSRRCDGFGEAVSSPHVPSGRFTFTETTAPNTASNDVLPEQTLEMLHTDDKSTGRSVPNTPLQTSPHESGPSCEEQTSRQAESDIPSINISVARDDVESGDGGDCMGPPSMAGTSAETSQQHGDQSEEMQEGEDGVTSEGEKAASTEEGEEEGREAEASPSTRSRNVRGLAHVQTARRGGGMRGSPGGSPGGNMRGARMGPQPIVWANNINNYAPRALRRGRGRSLRSPYGGRY